MSAVLRMLKSGPQKQTQTALDTILITPDLVDRWLSPPFQRPLRVTPKVEALAEQIKTDGGVVPGVITLGVLDGREYLLDGQHRRKAFLMSGCDEGYSDIRRHHFANMAEMGEEFVNLNSSLVRLRPDDILRGMEGVVPALSIIRRRCPFVGYDMVRRGGGAPLVSMSAVIRCWSASMLDVPQPPSGGVASMLKGFTADDAEQCADFLALCDRAWGRDPEYYRLWGNLTLALCAWLYRRTVLIPPAKTSRTTRLTKDLFVKGMSSLSASSKYMDWLPGRMLRDLDRSPGLTRIKAIIAKRVEDETGQSCKLPAPEWAAQGGARKDLL